MPLVLEVLRAISHDNVPMLTYSPPAPLMPSTPLDRTIESVSRVLEVLRAISHNGFPVWARPTDVDETEELGAGEDVERRLKGLIMRSQLLVLLQRRHFVDEDGQPVGEGQGGQEGEKGLGKVLSSNSHLELPGRC